MGEATARVNADLGTWVRQAGWHKQCAVLEEEEGVGPIGPAPVHSESSRKGRKDGGRAGSMLAGFCLF